MAENNLDKIRLAEAEWIEKLLTEEYASSARLHEVVASLCKIIRDREEKKNKSTNVLSKIKRIFKQAQSRMMSLRTVEASELRKRIDKLTDEVEAKNLEHQIMPGLVEEIAMLREWTAKLREDAKKDEANVAVFKMSERRGFGSWEGCSWGTTGGGEGLRCLQEEVLAVEKAVAEVLQVAEKV